MCDPCDNNCATCSVNVTQCSSCNNSVPLYLFGTTCLSSCPSNYFIKNNVCKLCELPCRLCTTTINTCSACFTNSTKLYWYQFECIDAISCPIGNFINYINSSCNRCPSEC